MLEKRKLIKFLAIIYVLGMIIWLGGSVVRTVIAYDIYVPATALQMKTNYTDELRLHNVRLFGMGALYTEISYACSFVAAIMLFVLLRSQFKTKGWIFISLMLFFITVPMESILMYYDIKLNLAIRHGILNSFDMDIVRDFFISRFTKLNFLAPSAYLCGASSIIIGIWQPLDKLSKRIVANKE